MNRKIFLCYIFLVISWGCFCQNRITGKILNSEGKVLSNVNVTVRSLGSARILIYSKSNNDGFYQLTVDNSLDSVIIKVSSLNYNTESRTVKNITQVQDFTLQEGILKLKELVVKPPPIVRNGDTIQYNINEFIADSDRTIGDVLRKIPGIDVELDGGIKFQGKSINAYYVEGLNLMNGRYGLINENLSAKAVSSIEIIENHQPIKILDSLQFSERAAININLKKKNTFSTNLHYGLGAKPFLWDINATPLFFTGSLQMVGSIQSNNIGNNIRNQLKDHLFDISLNSNSKWLRFPHLKNPPISDDKWFLNTSNISSLNLLKKARNEIEVKLNTSLIIDNQKQSGSSKTSYFLGSETLEYKDSSDFSSNYNSFEVNLSVLKNSKTGYFNNSFKFSKDWELDKGLNSQIATQFQQKLTSDEYSVNNSFHRILPVKKTIYNLYSDILFSSTAQRLSLSVVQLDSSKFIFQNFAGKNFQAHNFIEFSKKVNTIVFSVKIGNKTSFDNIQTRLVNYSNNYDPQNKIKWNSISSYISTTTRFSSKNRRWFSLVEVPLAHNYIDYINSYYSKSISRILIEPKIFIRRDLTKKVNLISHFQYNNLPSKLGSIYNEYIMIDYLSIIKRDNDFEFNRQINSNFGVNFNNNENLLNALVSYGLKYSSSNLIANHNISPNGFKDIQYNAHFNRNTSHTLSSKISKTHLSIKTNTSVSLLYTRNNVKREVNSSINNFSYNSISPNINLSYYGARFLTTEYNFNYLILNNSIQQRSQMKNAIKVFAYPTKNILVKLIYENYNNNSTYTHNSHNFADVLIRLTSKRKYKDIEIQASNIFNTRKFQTLDASDLYFSESILNLRPFQILLRGRLNF